MKNDILSQIENSTKLREKLSDYENEFTRKPYLIENQNLFLLASYAKYIFAFISIASAFYFVFTIIFSAIPLEILAILLAVVLLLILEIAKFNALPPLLKTWLKTNKINKVLGLVNILFIAFSVYLSVKGIEKYALEQRAIKPILINQDSLTHNLDQKITETERNYDMQIKQIQQDKNGFKNQIEWQGKINLYDVNTAQRLAAFDKQIETLQAQKNLRLREIIQDRKQKLQKTEQYNQTNLQKAEHLTATNTLYLIGLAFSNEILALLCLFYGIFYKYKSVSELDILKNYSENITLSANDIPVLFSYLQTALNGNEKEKISLKKLPNQQQSLPHFAPRQPESERPQIGFKIGSHSSKTKLNSQSSSSPSSQQATESTLTKIYRKNIIVKKELPRKEKYSAEERMEKNLDVVEAIRKCIYDFGKVNYTNIAKTTGRDYRTVREVYQAMLVLNLI